MGQRSGVSRLKDRIKHLERLQDGAVAHTVDQADQSLQQAYEAGGRQPASILIRRSFLKRRTKAHGLSDRSPRRGRLMPPAATLIPSRGSLRLELTLLFLNQVRKQPSKRVRHPLEPTEGEVAVLDCVAAAPMFRGEPAHRASRQSMRLRSLRNALNALARKEVQLIDLTLGPDGQPTWEQINLNEEAGPRGRHDVAPYRWPRSEETVISVPIPFFTQGWLQVLSESEIAAWLMWRNIGKMREPDQDHTPTNLWITGENRLGYYDLTQDAWDSHHLLTRAGLMTVEEGEYSSEAHVNGTQVRRAPHQFGLRDAGLLDGAVHSTLAALAERRDEATDRQREAEARQETDESRMGQTN